MIGQESGRGACVAIVRQRVVRGWSCGTALWWLMIVLVVVWRGMADDEDGILKALPAAPITAHDGALVVSARADMAELRFPVMTFAATVRGELNTALGVTCASRHRPVNIILGYPDGGSGALLSRLRDAAGVVREQVAVPDPDKVDLDELRFALVRAFLRSWLADVVKDEEHGLRGEPPHWVAMGLSRRQAREQRLYDFDDTHRVWSRGKLPLLRELLGRDSAVTEHPYVAGVLIGFLADSLPRHGLSKVVALAVAEEGWRPEALLAMLVTDGDPLVAELLWDRYMISGVRTVFIPGATTLGMLQRFCNQLPAFPLEPGAPMRRNWCGYRPEELLRLDNQPWVSHMASQKVAQLEAAAIGRDATMRRVVQDYALFFRAIAVPAVRPQAAGLLQTAETTLRWAVRQAISEKMLTVPLE